MADLEAQASKIYLHDLEEAYNYLVKKYENTTGRTYIDEHLLMTKMNMLTGLSRSNCGLYLRHTHLNIDKALEVYTMDKQNNFILLNSWKEHLYESDKDVYY